MNNFAYDPYAILQLDRNSSIQEVKVAFKALAKVYHPDKGGNPEMFRMLKEAYTTILGFIEGQSSRDSGQMNNRNAKDHLAELMQEQKVMQRGGLDHRNFSRDRFNAEFESQRNINSDFVYNIDLKSANKMNQKTFDQLQRERSSMNAEIGQIKPLFNRGRGFDPNVFNRIFDKYKNTSNGGEGALVPYQDPMPLTSHGNMDFSQAIQPHMGNVGGGGFAPLDQNQNQNQNQNQDQNQMFENPSNVPINDFRDLPDITQVKSLGRDEIKNRMSEYRNQSFNNPRAGIDWNSKPGMGAGIGNGAGVDPQRTIEYNSNFNNQSAGYDNQDGGMGAGGMGTGGIIGNDNSKSSSEMEALRRQLNEMQMKVQKFDEMEKKVKIQDKLIKKIHQSQQQGDRRRR